LFVLIVTVFVVIGVGGALAATHSGRTTASAPTAAPAGAGGEAAAPAIQGDVTPDLQAAKAAPGEEPKVTPDPKKDPALRATVTHAAATATHSAASRDEKDCWDDCGTSESVSAGSAGADDDGDGDGGDCGEGD
jgi:hypothetical protein